MQDDSDWKYLHRVFPQKDPKLFEYQCRAMYKKESNLKNHPWEEEEVDTLRRILQAKGSKIKWNEVSKELYFASLRRYYRNPKQCRERWLNHDDPNKKKGDWTAEECLKLFNFIKNKGKKWAILVKELGGSRNEHSIKNKFNSLVRKQKKNESLGNGEAEIIESIIRRIENTIRLGSSKFELLVQKKVETKLEEERKDEPKSYFHKNFMEKLLNFNPNKPREPVVPPIQLEAEKPVDSSFMDDEERSDLFEESSNEFPFSKKNELLFCDNLLNDC